jgi:hypothetical protein
MATFAAKIRRSNLVTESCLPEEFRRISLYHIAKLSLKLIYGNSESGIHKSSLASQYYHWPCQTPNFYGVVIHYSVQHM